MHAPAGLLQSLRSSRSVLCDADGVCVLVCQSVVLGSTTTALGITTAVPEASSMEKISIKLNNLHQEYSPQKKIEQLLKACKIIYDSMSISCPGQHHQLCFKPRPHIIKLHVQEKVQINKYLEVSV